MNIPKFSIKNFQLTTMLFVLLLGLGIYSFVSMPQLEDPVIELPNVFVVAIYPGASPQDLESQVVDVVEEAVNELDDIDEIITTIRDGVAITEVEFVFGTNADDKLEDVQRKINDIRSDLPSDLYDLDVFNVSTSTVPIYQIGLLSETASYGNMEKEAEEVKKEIETIKGVRKVEVLAAPAEEVRIALNPVKMAEMGISLDDIERAVRSNNANIPGGAIKVSNKLFNIKTSGAYEQLDQLKNTVVGSYAGKIIYLKNIASVYFDYEEDRWLARYNGTRCIYMTIQQKEGYNIFDVADPVKAVLDQYTLPKEMEFAYIFDQSEGVSDRVEVFLGNLLQGIFLVGLIILLALGYRSAGLVMLAIPLSILIGLSVVDVTGFALQQISIAGLVVALGLLVDNSIAIIENIERFLGMGFSRKEAAIKGTQQLVAPITSATLTTILAFIPILMIPDRTGAFIRALPVTVIATLAASLLVALTLTPLLASRLLRGRDGTSHPWLFRQFRRFVEGPYRRLLNWAFRHKYWVVGLSGLSLIGALSLFPLVGVAFFPKAEKPQFRIEITLPNGSNIDATNEAVTHVETVLEEYEEEIKYYAANVGHGNPRIYYNVGSVNYSNSYGDLFVVLKEYEVGRFYELLNELRDRFDTYTNARIDVKEFVQGPPSEAPVAIKIFGDDLNKLEAYAQQVENITRSQKGAVNISNPLATKGTDLYFNINRDKAMMLGVPIHVIDKTIRSFVSGAVIGKFRDLEAEEYSIVLKYDGDADFQLEDFSKVQVQSVSGRFIPLRQLASLEFEKSPSRISHLDAQRTATVLADLREGYTLDEVIGGVRAELDQIQWEDGYSYVFKGDFENRNQSFGGMGVASLVALVLIMGVLILQFKSLTQPLIIFTALPLAIIGSILALLINDIPFSFTAFVGLTSLIGIAINNSIVLVDFANKMREEGASVEQAAKQAGEVRFIPIVMTTLTTILGLLPLTLNGGSLWAPMGWTIIGGLLTSTTFVLLLVPILYKLLTRESAG
jgi:multidrug efflux pump subunit AcrB